MNSPVEDRLREALAEAGATVDTDTLRPLRAPGKRSFRVDLRLVTAAVVVVLAGATTAVWLGGRGDERSAALAGPAAAAPGLTEVQVFLCTRSAGDDPACEGQSATPDQVKSVEEAARRVPGVTSVAYVDQAEAYASFRRDFAADQAVLDEVTADELHASFRLLIGSGGDPVASSQELQRLPGVAHVAMVPEVGPDPVGGDGGAEITVFLCQRDSLLPACAPGPQREGRAATKADKDSVVALLRAVPEVASFVFEDQETAFKNFKEAYADNEALVGATRVEDMPESYRVRVKARADRSELVRALSRQRGVGSVVDQRCLAQKALLANRYLLKLPDGKVCPSGG